MKQFKVVMMCTACKWKISDELTKHGYKDFDIDMNSSVLSFKDDVNEQNVINVVSKIGYKIEAYDPVPSYWEL
jgi:copper chaperone CopZ